MKFTSLFLVAAFAQDGGDDAAAAPQQAAPAGYGAQQESYGGAEESYGAEEAQEYTTSRCLIPCPRETPMLNTDTGACTVRASYVASESYGGAQQESYGGQTTQGGYRTLQESYGGAQQESYDDAGTGNIIDSEDMYLGHSGRVSLWVGFIILFLSAVWFSVTYYGYLNRAEKEDESIDEEDFNETQYFFLANPTMVAAVVCYIASLAYLIMATGYGSFTQCNGRSFMYVRYIDWVITTPLLLHAIAHFGNMADEDWEFIAFVDVIMIVSGLIASTIGGSEKWIFFGFSILAFVPILHKICKLKNATLDNRLRSNIDGTVRKQDWNTAATVAIGAADNYSFLPFIHFWDTFAGIANLTVLTWFFYPIVWILAEGTMDISVNAEVIAYTVLDVLAKGLFGFLIANSTRKGLKEVCEDANAGKFKGKCHM